MEPMGANISTEKEIVMKNLTTLALFIASAFVAAGPAPAQDQLVKATVPFTFTVGDHTLPAGTYTIGSQLSAPDVITIRNWDKKIAVFSLGQPDQSNPKYTDRLEFHKYGDHYYLSDIHTADGSMNTHFAPTKAEKRARTQVEEAGRFVNDPVLIALN
jgi:hypothetical protein